VATIPETIQKIKSFPAWITEKYRLYKPYFQPKEDVFIAILIILVGLASFGLGKLSAFETTPEPVEVIPTSVDSQTLGTAPSIETLATGTIVASKTGTRYYYPNCSGASRIKDENKVWYATEADAQAAGLKLASGCTK